MGEEQVQQPARGAAAQKPGRKSFGVGFFLVLIIALAVALSGLYYQEEVYSMILLKPWDKSGPRGAVDTWAAALKTNDPAAIQAASARELNISVEGDEVTGISQGAMLQPNPPEALIPAGPAADVEVKFDLRKDKRQAEMMMPAADGGTLIYYAVPVEGTWKILAWSRSRPKGAPTD